MDIQQNLRRIFELYFKNFLVLFISTLLTLILSCLSLGILAGPLLGGLILICLKLLRGEETDFKEIFSHFDQFLPTLIITILSGLVSFLISIIGAIPIVGWVFSLAVSPALFLVSLMAIAFVVDENLNLREAINKSVKSFLTDPPMVWIYSLILGILSSLGAFLFIVPVVLTAPLGVIGAALAYQVLSLREPGTLKLEKKVIQIGLAILGSLLVLGIIFRFTLGLRPSFLGRSAFYRPKQNFSEKLAGKFLSSMTGEKVEIGRDGSSMTVSGVTFGEKLPKDYPRDITLYPKAEIQAYLGASSGDNSSATFSTKDQSKLVAEFYQRELENKGWSVETSNLGGITLIFFEKEDGRSGSVSITSTEDETTFIIALKKE